LCFSYSSYHPVSVPFFLSFFQIFKRYANTVFQNRAIYERNCIKEIRFVCDESIYYVEDVIVTSEMYEGVCCQLLWQHGGLPIAVYHTETCQLFSSPRMLANFNILYASCVFWLALCSVTLPLRMFLLTRSQCVFLLSSALPGYINSI
jgi:hypothetical protein